MAGEGILILAQGVNTLWGSFNHFGGSSSNFIVFTVFVKISVSTLKLRRYQNRAAAPVFDFTFAHVAHLAAWFIYL